MKVIVKEKSQEYKGFFTLEKSRLQFQKQDGSLSEEVVRENFYRGDSVAALVYDVKEKRILLVKQFRYPVYTVEPDRAWIYELVAGSCERGEDPLQTLVRELAEEIHIDADAKKPEHISSFFVSPGGTSERIYLYALQTDLSNYTFERGGVKEEAEDIEIVLMSFDEVFSLLEQGQIIDAKTIIALQYLELMMLT